MAFEFRFPDVGEGVHEGKILQVKYQSGDKVSEGDVIAVVETDKVVADIPSPVDGLISKIHFDEGQVIEVGQVLATIQEEGTVAKEPVTQEDNAGVVGELETDNSGMVMPASGEGMRDDSPDQTSLSNSAKRVLATPLARKLASDLGIDLRSVKGTGPAGRVTKKDLLELKNTSKVPPEEKQTHAEMPKTPNFTAPVVHTVEDKEIELSTMRKTIARNMEASHSIPSVTLTEEVDLGAITQLRSELKEKYGRISFQPIFMKALSIALKEFPQFNATFYPAESKIMQHGTINMGLAMETEKGLMVPVIRNVEQKSILAINHEMMELVEKGKSGTIALGDLRDGTISITNYGAFGGIYGTPMILPPQVAIMGFGRIHEKPIVKNGEIVVGKVLPLSFVFDHRVLDGAPASQFVTRFKELLENPISMIASMI